MQTQSRSPASSASPAAPVSPAAPEGAPPKLWPVYVWSVSFLKPYAGLFLLLLLVMGVLSAAELIVPQFIRTFIDQIVPERDWRRFHLLLAGLGGVILLVLGASMLNNLLQRHLQEKAARDLQHTIFTHLRKLGFAYYEQNPVGQTLSFLNTEVAALQNMYRTHFPFMISGSIFSLISIAMMASLSLRLTAVVIPCFLLYYLFGPMLERKASLTGKVMSEHRVAENQKVYESVSALTELRVFAAEPWDLRRFLEKVATFNASMIRTYWYAYWRGTNRRLTYNVGAVAIFIYGFYLLKGGSLSVGAFVSFILYYFTAMHRLTAVVTNVTEQKVLMYQAERLYRFVRQSPEVEEAAQPVHWREPRGHIRFRGVTFAYRQGGQGKPVLQSCDLEVRPGERFALVGTTGNGKSTVLKLIGRFYDPQEGEITIDGVPLNRLSFSSLRQSLGYVMQETYLFGTTVRDNIKFGRPQAGEDEVVAAARAAYAHDFIEALPDGYDTIVGERGVKLSGGQKQRIAIARMLIKNPAVVLLDEATSTLDNTSEAEVQKAFGSLLHGRTVVAVAHRLSTVKDFDRIAVIEDGRVAEIGTYDELMRLDGAFRHLVQGQEREAEKEAAHG
ncbi:ABC transporter ATP-binding protein [Paenibacillus cymbidii]|uniref:ABC transporter ATP-binding protein n=1 Tax=Paenibacillus cymbidii TaxID=1639034 RepID=UPI001081CBD5|nr:ABC transporter ATP-binding protein [Paenibacillus cymbidii]